jgi:hypothetical protein
MPIHDWTRVPAGIFHDFHQVWTIEIRHKLNSGVLPKGYYALVEQTAGGPRPDVVALERHEDFDDPDDSSGSGAAVASQTALLATESPPKVRYSSDDEPLLYAAKANRVAIRHVSGDRVVAFIEIVSAGNKQTAPAVKQFIDKLADTLIAGCHLLVVDLHPPGKHDPAGLPALFWSAAAPEATPSEPLSAASYRAGSQPGAYFELPAVGAVLPDMPLFLTSERYINVPLASTYEAAWRGVPERWQREIET